MQEYVSYSKELAAAGVLRAGSELAPVSTATTARADLLRRAGRKDEAITCYDKAISLTSNGSERCYLERRRAGLSRSIP
jgi:RNA polymerase sigma-70 factor (ECF subfamily)